MLMTCIFIFKSIVYQGIKNIKRVYRVYNQTLGETFIVLGLGVECYICQDTRFLIPNNAEMFLYKLLETKIFFNFKSS